MIEYGFGKPAIDESYTDEKIYYLGDVDYYIQDDDVLKGIRTDQEIERNVLTQRLAVAPLKEDQSIAQYWDFIYDSISPLQLVQASHGEDERVDNPEDYEHNYDDLYMQYLRDYRYAISHFGINYIVEPDEDYQDGACGLIAAANAMVEWYYGYDESVMYGTPKHTYHKLKEITIEEYGDFAGVGLVPSEIKDTVEKYLEFMDYSTADV